MNATGTKQKTGIIKDCNYCGNAFYVEPNRIPTAKFCSILCHNRNIGENRKPMTQETKDKIGKSNSKSRGGITMVVRQCINCEKRFKTRLAYVNRGGGKYCSNSCKMTYFIGRPKTSEHLAKISGKNANNWQGGKTTENQIIRHRKETRLVRESAYKRDDYTCQECGARGGNGKTVVLNAHHIKPFSLFPELRFALDNVVTLCVDCHRKTDNFGSKINRLKSKTLC